MEQQWLYDLVFEYMHAANKNSGWNFEIDGAESMQIGRYGKGCFYNTHHDGDGTTLYNYPDNKWMHKKTRKLSMSMVEMLIKMVESSCSIILMSRTILTASIGMGT